MEYSNVEKIGIADIILGTIFSLIQIGILIFIYTGTRTFYQQLGISLPIFIVFNPVVIAAFLAFFMSVILIGIRIVNYATKELFIIGLSQLVIMVFIAAFYVGSFFFNLKIIHL